MTIHGRVMAVTDESVGTYLTAAALAAATTLYVEDASVFLETGGLALLEDDGATETVTYSAADWEADTLTVTATSAAWSANARILVSPAQSYRMAQVRPDDSELGVIHARVPYSLAAQLPEGIRESGDEEEAIVELVRGFWQVYDLPGGTPVVDGAYVNLIAEQVEAENIAAGAITADKLEADLILSNTFKTASEGQRVEIDGDGLRLMPATGDAPIVELPTETGAPATFAGSVDAESLTVTEATFQGETTFDTSSAATLASTQSNPSFAPVVNQSIATLISDIGDGGEAQRGLWYWEDEGDYIFLDGPTDGTYCSAYRLNSSAEFVDICTLDLPSDFLINSIIYHEENDVWVGTGRKVSNGEWSFLIWEDDGAGMPGAYVTRGATPSTSVFNAWPTLIKNNGSSDMWCLLSASSQPVLHTLEMPTPGTVPYSSSNVAQTSPDDVWTYGVAGACRVTADFGATRIVAIPRLSGGGVSDFYTVFNTSMAEQTTQYFEPANSADWGIVYNGSNLVSLARTDGRLNVFGTWTESGLTENQYQFAYSWYDSAGTTHETGLSPRTELAHKSRRQVSVAWPTIPSGGADDPDSVRVYAIDNDSDQGSTFANYYRQGSGLTGTSTTLTSYSTGTVGSQGTAFAAGTPAYIVPQTGTAYVDGLHGDGYGFVPIGTVVMWSGPYNEMPPGWLLCDGTAVSRTTYDKLHAILKDVGGADAYGHGSGNGTTTFNLPDFRGAFPLGVGASGSSPADGETAAGGSHSTDGGHTHNDHGQASNTPTTGAANRLVNPVTHSNDGGHAHDAHTYANTALPPYTAVNFIILADDV